MWRIVLNCSVLLPWLGISVPGLAKLLRELVAMMSFAFSACKIMAYNIQSIYKNGVVLPERGYETMLAP